MKVDTNGTSIPTGPLEKTLLVITPVIAAAFMLHDAQHFIDSFFRNEEVPLWLLIFGSMGQIIFTLRFVYQWAYSFHHKEPTELTNTKQK
jgi:hypothetical protein